MSFDPTGLSALSLVPGIVDSPAFTFFQVNASGQLDMFLQRATGAPQLVYTTIPQPINYDVANITGKGGSFQMVSGLFLVKSETFDTDFGINMPLGGQTAIGWWGPESSGGLYNHGYMSDGNPHYRNRSEDETSEVLLEYNNYIGNSIKINSVFGTRSEFSLPGNMTAYVGNSYQDNSWISSVTTPSSADAPSSDYTRFIGTTFLTWNGVSELRRNFTIFPAYCELGGAVSSDDPYADLGGYGAVVIRPTVSTAPNVGHPNGLTINTYINEEGKFPLNILDTEGNSVELYPGIKNIDRIQLGANAYTGITVTRNLLDSDNGKILYTTTGNYELAVPNGLLLPFSCSIKCEGTGRITFTGAGGVNVRNAYGRYKTAGQYTVCGLDLRSGTNCILFGDTDL